MSKSRIEREREMLPEMIRIYCHGVHKTPKNELCPECTELCAYALNRLDHCKFGNKKTFCSQCPIHCYQKNMREKIRNVMRYAGPRTIFSHPLAGTLHAFSTMRGVIKQKRSKKSEHSRERKSV